MMSSHVAPQIDVIPPRRSRLNRRHSTRLKNRRQRRVIFERLEVRSLLAGDLVAQWRANDLLGDHGDGQHVEQWMDSVSSIPATAFGTPILADDSIGGRPAIRFDSEGAKDGFLVAEGDNPLSGANDFSVAVWFVVSTLEATDADDWHDGTGLVHSDQKGFNRDWGIALHDGQVAAGIGTGLLQPSTSVFSAQTDLTDGQPHLAVFTRAAGSLALHVDDDDAVTSNGASTEARDTLDLTFGVPNSFAGTFAGEIAEVRIYDGALTVDEVAELRQEIDAFYGNSVPVANDDHYSIDEDATLFVRQDQGLLANDTDAEDDTLSAVVVQQPQHGVLGLNENGGFVYDPGKDFFGTDTFTYVANDFRDSEPATVTIEVRPKEDLAVGVSDSYASLPTELLEVDAENGILTNDINVDQQSISAVLHRDVSFGNLNLAADGSFTYRAEGSSGLASFAYRISDAGNLSEPTQVLILVNTPPVAVDDACTVEEDAALVIAADEGLAANDFDADGDDRNISVIDLPTHGELTWDASGAFDYRPAPNFAGSDRFTYSINDGTDESNVATVSLTVASVNDPPNVTGEAYYVSKGTPLSVPPERGLLANDTDVEDVVLTANVQGQPSHGQLEFMTDGSFNYTPDANFSGIDEFSYTVRDTENAEVSADVRLYVGTSPVQISEVVAANDATLETSIRSTPEGRFESDVLTPDWIELANTSNQTVDIGGLFLTDDADRLSKWRIPDGVVVPANGHLVILATRLDITDPRLDELGLLHTNFKLSSDPGEYIGLASPDGQLLDAFESIPEARPDFPYGRQGESIGYLDNATPGAPNGNMLNGIVADIVFSSQRGFYDTQFEVELNVETPEAVIYYTRNGSNPTPQTGQLYTGPITVDTTSSIRAAAFKSNHVPSRTTTHSYFFVADILRQPAAPEGFPDRWGRAGRADYAMDERIATDQESDIFDANVAEGLRSLPTISLTMDVEDFFGASGIQSNPQSKGDEWERTTSVEFIDFEGFGDSQLDSGIRMVGNASRNPNRRKHNIRLAFRDDYGESSLNLPLFGLGAGEEHENLILRGGNGDSWVNSGVLQRAQYIRDQWQRDLQFAMGHLSTHQLYSHLYINGLYWGLYHVFERHDASFMALHMGGDPENYEAIKDVNGNTAAVEPVSGDTDAWQEIFDIVDDRDIPAEQKYEEVQQRVDVDNMIDYLLINFYAGNNDWDHNNFRTGRHVNGKFIFFTWDAERADINALGTPARGGPVTINVTSANKPGRPTRIHAQLRDSDEYLIRFADRVHKHFFNNGALTPEGASGLWNARADEIRLAISTESARWGDLHARSRPRTLDDWESTLQFMNEEFFPVRTDIVLEQLQRRGAYPDVAAPAFSQHGGQIDDNFELSINATDGIVYYTSDGTDPRQPGGAISPTAVQYRQPIAITSDTKVLARVMLNEGWSALTEADFETVALPADASSLRISEIHFNPADPSETELAAGVENNDEFEFIELVNISPNTIDLQGIQFLSIEDQGVRFDFGQGKIKRLRPNERLLVVENTEAFALRYGNDLPVVGQWSGRLGNGGETISLAVGDTVFLQMTYDDQWYPETDGVGHSLEVLDLYAEDFAIWNTSAGYRASRDVGGTPGSDSSEQMPGDSNGDGVFDSSDLVSVFQAGEYEDPIVGNSTFEEGDWNGDGDFNSSDLVFVFQLGSYVAGAGLFELLR